MEIYICDVYRDLADMETISLCDEMEALMRQFNPDEEQYYG